MTDQPEAGWSVGCIFKHPEQRVHHMKNYATGAVDRLLPPFGAVEQRKPPQTDSVRWSLSEHC